MPIKTATVDSIDIVTYHKSGVIEVWVWDTDLNVISIRRVSELRAAKIAAVLERVAITRYDYPSEEYTSVDYDLV